MEEKPALGTELKEGIATNNHAHLVDYQQNLTSHLLFLTWHLKVMHSKQHSKKRTLDRGIFFYLHQSANGTTVRKRN